MRLQSGSKFINNANKHLKASNSTEITVINVVGYSNKSF